MVCYAVPLAGALLFHGWRSHARVAEPKYLWLNLMLLGGAVFGVVDHLWNGELFPVGPGTATDLALGFVITAAILASWALVVRLSAVSPGPAPNPA